MIYLQRPSIDQHQSHQTNTNLKPSNKTFSPKKTINLYEVNKFSKAKFGFS